MLRHIVINGPDVNSEDDIKLDLHAVEQNGPSSVGSYGLPEPRFNVASNVKYQGAQADLMDLQQSHASSNALAVLTNDMQKLNISSPVFNDETTSEMWVWLRLHRAAILFDIPALAEECVVNMSDICNGSAYAADFIKFIHRLHDAVHLDISRDGPSHVIANECAMNIEYLLDDGEFTNFLRERDGFSYLIIQKLKERYEMAAAIAAEERPRLLLTSPEDDVGDSALLRLGDDAEEYRSLNAQLTTELDTAKVDVAVKHQQVIDVSGRLERSQQDLANANDKMAQLRASIPAAVVQRGRGTFTDLSAATETSTTSALDDVRRRQAKKITDLEADFATLTKDLNQARLGRDEFRNNMMTTNTDLEKENKRLQLKSEEALSAAKTSSLAFAASSERVDKLEKALALCKSREEAAALDTLETKDLQSNMKTYIAGLELEVAVLKSEVSSKDIKLVQLSTAQPLSVMQPLPIMQPRPSNALSQASSECAVRSASPSPSITTAGSIGGVAPGSHGGVMTFAEKQQVMMQRRRQMTAGVTPQQSLLLPNVNSSSSQSSGGKAISAALPSQTNRVQLQQITQSNGVVPSQTNGTHTSHTNGAHASQTNGVIPAQGNGIAATQASVQNGPVISLAPAAVPEDEEVAKFVQDENANPARRILGPHHAAGPSDGPPKPTTAIVYNGDTQSVVEVVASMKSEMDTMRSGMDTMKKRVMGTDAANAKLTKERDFARKQLSDARNGPMSSVTNSRSGGKFAVVLTLHTTNTLEIL